MESYSKFGSILEHGFDYSNFLSITSEPLNGDIRPNERHLNISFASNIDSDIYGNCASEDTAGDRSHADGLNATTRMFRTRMMESFIPGAISNRTLEYLTESTLRPTKSTSHLHSGRQSPGQDKRVFGRGTIGDRGGANCFSPDVARNASVMNLFNDGRLLSPPDSDFNENFTQTNPYSSILGGVLNAPSNNNGNNLSPAFDLLKALGLQSDIPLQRQAGHHNQQQQQQPLQNDFSLSADLFASRPWTSLSTLFSTNSDDPHSIDRAAKLYRNAATISEPTCTWSGQLPIKIHRNPAYSLKVFLGGVPWDITEAGLQNCFRSFGPLKIEWPGKDGKHPRYPTKGKELPVGYVYILFESERSVRALLQSCTQDFNSHGGEYYFKISSKRMRSKEVQVIPWIVSDSNYIKNPSQRLDSRKTVFVGALHGMLSAEGLALILNDLFGNVVFAGIDTDKHKYPIGSGRVTFSSDKSYVKAVTAAFVEIKTTKFTKKIQIDPYLEESLCDICQKEQGSYFCRDFKCFVYYCRPCWQAYHSAESFHKPLMRNNKVFPA